MNKEIPDTKI